MERYTFEAERLKTIRIADYEKSVMTNHAFPKLEGRTVILVDEGAQSGTTALTAVEMIHSYNPDQIILALPVCSREAWMYLNGSVDALIVDTMPSMLHSLSDWYLDFLPERDDKVRNILSTYTPVESPRSLKS